MATKARKKRAAKAKKKRMMAARKKRKAAVKTKPRTAARKKAARKAKSKGVIAEIAGGFDAVMETLSEAQRLRRKLEPRMAADPE
jgi:hypothetical protein